LSLSHQINDGIEYNLISSAKSLPWLSGNVKTSIQILSGQQIVFYNRLFFFVSLTSHFSDLCDCQIYDIKQKNGVIIIRGEEMAIEQRRAASVGLHTRQVTQTEGSGEQRLVDWVRWGSRLVMSKDGRVILRIERFLDEGGMWISIAFSCNFLYNVT
jgi:hypothetical protein